MRRNRIILTGTVVLGALICSVFAQGADRGGPSKNGIPSTLPTNPWATTRPSLSLSDAVKALDEAQARCIARLGGDENYRAAVAAEKDAEQRRSTASDDDRADAAAQLLAARTAVHKIESAAFGSDKDVIKARKDLNAAQAADAHERAQTAADSAKARAADQEPEAQAKAETEAEKPSSPTHFSEYDWFVELDDTNGYYASPGVPQPAIAALQEAQKDNTEIGSFAFTPDGDWVALSRDRYWSDRDELPLCQKLQEMQQKKQDTKCVAFAPAGPWIILHGRNGFWGPGSPVWVKVKDLVNNGHEVRAVSFGPGDGYVVLYDRAGISYDGIPDDLVKVLDSAVGNNIPIRCVAFTGRDWICLAQDDWWTSDPDLPAAKFIDKERRLGLHPRWIAFVPNLGKLDAEKFGTIIHQTIAGKIAGGYACEVIDRGKVVVSHAEGWARAPWESVSPSVAWTIDKPIEIASVSKTITAAALLKLWEESASTSHPFSLDDPFWPYIRRIFPTASIDVKTITIRQVLMHRSGFGHDVGNNPTELRQLLTLQLAHQPGTFFKYENINYFIIRLLIEQIGRVDYPDYVKTHVLAPMGIMDMETHSEDREPTCCYGKPGTQESGDEGAVDSSSWVGPGGWYASAADLGKFLEGLRQFSVLTPATTAMMFKDNLGWDSGDPWTKGGLHIGPNEGRNHTAIAYFPDGMEAVLLVNCEHPEPPNAQWLLVQAWKDARY